ncbi:MAG: glycosyltransferase family 2 protein [Candidatus Tritonobacter lacicola]|nr:glycosyltransferase family 2 protein [Candidatus Tritonobacter lacicola]
MRAIKTDISIIIVNWNTKGFLRNCIKSIYDHEGGYSLEVIVVDNASSDGSTQMVKAEFPSVRLIQNRSNEGFARANNRAAAVAKGEHLFFLNPDTELVNSAPGIMMEFLHAHPDVGAVGCCLISPDGSVQDSCGFFPGINSYLLEECRLDRFSRFIPAFGRSKLRCRDCCAATEVDWVIGAAIMVPSHILRRVGGFPEDYFLYLEDTDLCRRIKGAGYRVVYFPEARVIHHWEKSATQDKVASYYEHYRSAYRYFHIHEGPFYAMLYAASMLGACGIRIFPLLLAGVVSERAASRAVLDWKVIKGVLLGDISRVRKPGQ